MNRRLLSLMPLATSFILFGCAARDVEPDDGANASAEGALTQAARGIVGRYVSPNEVDTYATELNLESDGSFSGSLERGLLQRGACRAAPCVAPVEGRWGVTHESEEARRLWLSVRTIEGAPAGDDDPFFVFRFRVEAREVSTLIVQGTNRYDRGEQQLIASDESGSSVGVDAGPTARYNCDRGDVACRSMPPRCAAGEVPSVDGACWGPCVSAAACR